MIDGDNVEVIHIHEVVAQDAVEQTEAVTPGVLIHDPQFLARHLGNVAKEILRNNRFLNHLSVTCHAEEQRFNAYLGEGVEEELAVGVDFSTPWKRCFALSNCSAATAMSNRRGAFRRRKVRLDLKANQASASLSLLIKFVSVSHLVWKRLRTRRWWAFTSALLGSAARSERRRP